MKQTCQVVTVGHAIVDVLASCEDGLIASLGLTKGNMALVDEDEAGKIYAALGPAVEASGGSAANTAACLASLGASVGFVGKVGPDPLGQVFTHDIRAAGVVFDPPPAASGDTGRCLILVSHDAEKTMCTNLGIGGRLGAADVDAALVGGARVVYLEGYLCGKAESAAAVEEAIAAARRAGALVAMSASDPGWVELVRDELWELVGRVDILFANEHEARGLAGPELAAGPGGAGPRIDVGDLDAAVDVLARRCPTAVVTLGAEGCVVAAGGRTVRVPAYPVEHPVDTTGAGDSFAAGYLYGVVNGLGAETSARIGALVAAEVVSHMGARPQTDLADLARSAGLV